jgi:hypothetical protein
VLLENLGNQPLAASRLPNVRLMQGHGGPAPRSVVAHCVRSGDVASVRSGHRDTGLRQPLGDGTADPPGSARD